MRAHRLQRPLAGGLPLAGGRLPAALPHPLPQAPAVQCLPPPDFPRRRHDLRRHQAAADRLVPGDPPADAGQARRFVAGTGASAGRQPEHRLQGEAQAPASDEERDERVPLRGIVHVDDAYWGGERTGGKRGRGAAGKTPFVAAVQVTADGKPERMRMSSVAGFRKKTLAARHGGAFRRPGLLPGRGRHRLRAPADRHRRREAELRGFPLRPGQHDAG